MYQKIIFQDPYAALNPRMTIRSILAEPLKIHKLCKTTEKCNKRIDELLDYVQPSKDTLHKYPHEFSGGQRQNFLLTRACIIFVDIIQIYGQVVYNEAFFIFLQFNFYKLITSSMWW